jgi:predicted RNA-binding protein (virulence factor B family)
MIPKHEDTSHLRVGDVITARVIGVKEDGKLDISIREKGVAQMDADAEKVLGIIKSYAGVLPFTEKASPEIIKRETGLSKNAFKRAVGRLYKERIIDISDGKIRLV